MPDDHRTPPRRRKAEPCRFALGFAYKPRGRVNPHMPPFFDPRRTGDLVFASSYPVAPVAGEETREGECTCGRALVCGMDGYRKAEARFMEEVLRRDDAGENAFLSCCARCARRVPGEAEAAARIARECARNEPGG